MSEARPSRNHRASSRVERRGTRRGSRRSRSSRSRTQRSKGARDRSDRSRSRNRRRSRSRSSSAERPRYDRTGSEVFFSRGHVYLASSDRSDLVDSNARRVRSLRLRSVDSFVSVIGGLTGLSYLLELPEPRKVTLFDVNPHSVEYARLIVELVRISTSHTEFIERVFSRRVVDHLDYDSQSKYLQQPADLRLLDDTLRRLSAEGRDALRIYLLPFLRIAPDVFERLAGGAASISAPSTEHKQALGADKLATLSSSLSTVSLTPGSGAAPASLSVSPSPAYATSAGGEEYPYSQFYPPLYVPSSLQQLAPEERIGVRTDEVNSNCCRLLPCWKPGKYVPVTTGGCMRRDWDDGGKLVPNTNVFHYGHGWLASKDKFLHVKRILINAELRMLAVDILDSSADKNVLLNIDPGRSNVIYISNIDDFFVNKWSARAKGLKTAARTAGGSMTFITATNGIRHVNTKDDIKLRAHDF